MRHVLAALASMIVLASPLTAAPASPDAAWTITLKAADFVVGPALQKIRTRHAWNAGFDDQTGAFEVALRKSAVAIAAPKCRMDYLILVIPSYYPESPKKASAEERRGVYDALVAIQARGSGAMTARVEAPLGLAQKGAAGPELVACNLYFALPLSVQVSQP
jgi:hypothetical protein